MDIESKIWGYANTGRKLHAFVGDHAVCSKRIPTRTYLRKGEGMDYSQTKMFSGALCKNCDRKFNAAIEAEEAFEARRTVSMQPSTGEGDHLPPAQETNEEITMNPNITPEVIKALAWLRKGWNGDNSERAIDALDILDNAGIFSKIDEASGYDIDGTDAAPERVSKCTCPASIHGGKHAPACPGDPAEWGDMAYTTAPEACGGIDRNGDRCTRPVHHLGYCFPKPDTI